MFDDLEVGQNVSVEGLLTVAGPVNASLIVVADEDVVTNDTIIEGDIITLDPVTRIIQVVSSAETFTVGVGFLTVITTDDDADDLVFPDPGVETNIAFEDLAPGQTVSIEGLLVTGGPVTVDATSIRVADDDVVTNDIAIFGTIAAFDTVTSVIQVQTATETVSVAVTIGTVITTDDDADDAADTGATVVLGLGDLAVGQTVSVQGLILTGGAAIDAVSIDIADASISTI